MYIYPRGSPGRRRGRRPRGRACTNTALCRTTRYYTTLHYTITCVYIYIYTHNNKTYYDIILHVF